ncbi:ADP-ribosylation factor-like protein 16 isoform X5 [Dendropsophus ebraccatus]|uniref:ADP-ribosylation factor-like protein 16 isoform X5 n=1 Tax=Dendropsophus ebraccatus TaxID=150705 RepID=UPI003831ACE2
MCLVLGPSGVGKTLLMKRLHKLCTKDSDLGEVPPTQPTVGTNLTDLTIQRTRVTVREVGGSMVPIWPSYYKDCQTVLFIVDAANINQVSASCIQLLSLLSAPALSTSSVLVVFNKTATHSTASRIDLVLTNAAGVWATKRMKYLPRTGSAMLHVIGGDEIPLPVG